MKAAELLRPMPPADDTAAALVLTDDGGHEHRIGVSVLRLEPGDVIVVQSDNAITDSGAEWLRASVGRLFPGHEVAILDQGLKIGIIRKG